MALTGDTGNGATLTFGTSALAYGWDSIQIGEESVDMLEVSTLATTGYKEMVASDLKETPEITVSFVTLTTSTAVTVGAAPETITITFPQRTGETAAANIAGTAVVTSFVRCQQLANGEIQKGQLTFKYDGDTGPTWTAATTV